MRRLCERPGCAGAAEVSYGIDNVALLVWVDNNAVSERELSGRLCRRHANALSVPRGWTIDDRRDDIPRLFKALAEEVAAIETKPKRAPSKKVVHESPQVLPQPTPTLFDPNETQAIPWSPRIAAEVHAIDENESEEESPVFGRLLGRAFGKKFNEREE